MNKEELEQIAIEQSNGLDNGRKIEVIKELLFGNDIRDTQDTFKDLQDKIVELRSNMEKQLQEMREQIEGEIASTKSALKKEIDELQVQMGSEIDQLQNTKVEKKTLSSLLSGLAKEIED